MADKPNPTGPGLKIVPGSSELAPFVYCDGVALFGVSGGVIQLELATNTIMPEGAGTRTDIQTLTKLLITFTRAIVADEALQGTCVTGIY
jgi:hypothetical protein